MSPSSELETVSGKQNNSHSAPLHTENSRIIASVCPGQTEETTLSIIALSGCLIYDLSSSVLYNATWG
jgi:hypothetical protein